MPKGGPRIVDFQGWNTLVHTVHRKYFVIVCVAAEIELFPMRREIPFNPMISTYTMTIKATFGCLPAQQSQCPLNLRKTS